MNDQSTHLLVLPCLRDGEWWGCLPGLGRRLAFSLRASLDFKADRRVM